MALGRLGRGYVAVSEIAEQFYCEYKLQLSITEGKLVTPQMELGALIHDSVFKGRPVDPGELLRRIRAGERLVATLPLVHRVNGLVIVGIPDAVLFGGGRALAVIELKTSNKWLGTVFKSEYVQAQLYAHLLVSLGLAGRDVVVAIAKLRRDVEDATRSSVLGNVVKYLEQLGALPASVNLGELTIHYMPYDPMIEADLRWALAYWLGERGPRPSPSPGKCGQCEFRGICAFGIIPSPP